MENGNNNSRVRNMTTSVNEAGNAAPSSRSQRVAPSLRSGTSARERSSQAVSRPASASQKKRPVQTSSKKAAPAKTRSASKKKKKKSGSWFGQRSKFTKFIIIYAAAFIVITIIAAIILSSYLSRFEASQPTHTVEAVIQSFTSKEKLNQFLTDNKTKINPSMEGLEDTYYPLIEGKELNFISDSDNTTQEISSYYITADNSRVAAVTLAKSGADSWELSNLDLSVAYKDSKEYSILVPEGSTVTVNGTVLGQENITGTGVPEILEYSSQFISSKPDFTTYSVKSITGEAPSVSGTDASGQELVFTQSDVLFVAGGGAGQSFIDSVSERVEAGVDEYALYFEYLAFDLRDYILEDCLKYEEIFGSENFDRIDPSLYMFEYIKTHEFTEKSITNYTVYSDDCFTCDVKFNLLITFYQDGIYGPKDLPDDEIAMNATWVWVKEGDTWKIADIILK
ncbi:MAG: hypothetical protein E7233_11005 [Lachnospiraceae bacterium]|nr:hypothetical protein [Lachnospiraceae bacterium]